MAIPSSPGFLHCHNDLFLSCYYSIFFKNHFPRQVPLKDRTYVHMSDEIDK